MTTGALVNPYGYGIYAVLLEHGRQVASLRHLPACMHARIGTASAQRGDALLGEFSKRCFEHVLHCAHANLALPAVKAAAVVAESERQAHKAGGAGLDQASSARNFCALALSGPLACATTSSARARAPSLSPML